MSNLCEFKTETWSVDWVSGANDLMWVRVNSESTEILDSDETLQEIIKLATLDEHGRYLGKSKIRASHEGFKRVFYFQMCKEVKLKIMNNEEELPDERVYVGGAIRTLHVLYDQTLSEKKAFQISLVDTYGDKFLSLTILHRNNSNEYWERENIYLKIDDFMDITKTFNMALADILSQYEKEISIRNVSDMKDF